MLTPSTAQAVRRTAPALALVLVLSACGGSDETVDVAAAQDAQPPAGQSPAAPPQGGQMRPGASGLVAAVDGTTAQVQGNGTQTAVSWTDATAFTAQAAGSLADVAVGSCVVVRTAEGTAADATEVTAASVAVTEPVDGECAGPGGAGGLRGGGGPPAGARASGAPRTPPSGAPGGAPGGGMRGGLGGGATGEVTAVTDGGFTVRSVRFGMPGEQGTEPQTQDVAVTATGDTTVTKTVPAAADAVQPGVCVTASGESDSTGSVTATSISVRPAENGECTGGFGGFGGPGGPGA